jgi:hypothetical protein
MKKTNWEKRLEQSGSQIITWEHDEIVDYLLMIFNRDKDRLTLLAASDQTKRHTLCFIMDYEGIGGWNQNGNYVPGVGDTNFGGTVTYNKKLRRFTHITYSDWGVQFSIESRAAFFAYEHYKSMKKIFPFGASVKRLREWLLSN